MNSRPKLTFLSASFGRALRDCVRLFNGLIDGAMSWVGKKLKKKLKKNKERERDLTKEVTKNGNLLRIII